MGQVGDDFGCLSLRGAQSERIADAGERGDEAIPRLGPWQGGRLKTRSPLPDSRVKQIQGRKGSRSSERKIALQIIRLSQTLRVTIGPVAG